MMAIVSRVAALLCLALSAMAQPAAQLPAGSPVFDLADVHPSPHSLKPSFRSGMLHDDRYFLRDATLVDLISAAYHVDPANISGGPQWLAFDRFDILAKVAHSTPPASIGLMLRALLAERFSLVIRAEVKSLPAFVLSASGASRLRPADASAGSGGCEVQEPPGDAPPPASTDIEFSCRRVTMPYFADFLHNAASPYLKRPVVDSTGLKGVWNFDLKWTYRPPREGGGLSIFAAVDKQLGLRLEAKSAPQPAITVIGANEKPTPNQPGLDKVLPPAPSAEFEVAVIRPSSPDESHFDVDWDQSGMVTIRYATLDALISLAWDLGHDQLANEPKWLNGDHYDIVGKSALSAPSIPPAGSQMDIDEVKEMVRSLLAERFAMISHTEDRPVEAFALTAPNPRMKMADPANHPSCKEGPGPDGKDPRIENPLQTRLVYCQNMTMAQFAQELPSIAAGYLGAPVVDATGLEGAYDFALNFSSKNDLRLAAVAPRVGPSNSGAGLEATDPVSDGLTLANAISRQLGLKLEKRNAVPVPVLVIDHLEKKPTAN